MQGGAMKFSEIARPPALRPPPGPPRPLPPRAHIVSPYAIIESCGRRWLRAHASSEPDARQSDSVESEEEEEG